MLGLVSTCSCPHLLSSTCASALTLSLLLLSSYAQGPGTQAERGWKQELSLLFKLSSKCQFEGGLESSREHSLLFSWV